MTHRWLGGGIWLGKQLQFRPAPIVQAALPDCASFVELERLGCAVGFRSRSSHDVECLFFFGGGLIAYLNFKRSMSGAKDSKAD